MYATGSAQIPPMGLKKVKVRVSNDDAVYAATCVNSVKIPNFDNQQYDTFKAVMDSIITVDTFTSM
ncbi:MAG: HECT domain-containing protein [Proteobacteria bacterium]|nr:HECT domain-containing protein [Pseudomonadota bacterium]